MEKRIIYCQCWEWYGDEAFVEGRYKAKGGQEFIYDVTPETEALDEEELIELWNKDYNKDGLWYRYEAKRIDFFWAPVVKRFVDGKFID